MVFRAGFWVGGKCRLCVGAGCACRQVLVVGLVAARVLQVLTLRGAILGRAGQPAKCG